MQILLFGISILFGLAFAYVDRLPTWDDTGVLAFAIVITSAILGFLGPRRPRLWALGVGLWIPLQTILHGGELASLLALGGAYAGAALRKLRSAAI